MATQQSRTGTLLTPAVSSGASGSEASAIEWRSVAGVPIPEDLRVLLDEVAAGRKPAQSYVFRYQRSIFWVGSYYSVVVVGAIIIGLASASLWFLFGVLTTGIALHLLVRRFQAPPIPKQTFLFFSRDYLVKSDRLGVEFIRTPEVARASYNEYGGGSRIELFLDGQREVSWITEGDVEGYMRWQHWPAIWNVVKGVNPDDRPVVVETSTGGFIPWLTFLLGLPLYGLLLVALTGDPGNLLEVTPLLIGSGAALFLLPNTVLTWKRWREGKGAALRLSATIAIGLLLFANLVAWALAK